MKWLSKDPERGALLKPSGHGSARRSTGDALRWTCDADSSSAQVGREYQTKAPWDTVLLLLLLAIGSYFLEGALHDETHGHEETAHWSGCWMLMTSFACVALAVLALLLNPTTVRRETDSFVIHYPLHKSILHVGDVLELVMVSSLEDFFDLVVRWGVFPFGSRLTLFCGVWSGQSAACAVLTSNMFFSFYFCLEDPIKFLVDNQRPLDLKQRYRTLGRVLVREGELLTTKKIGMVRKGATLRIERQSGRRVFVHFEDTKVSGWMSYINQLGHFLLSKEANSLVAPAAGTVGASEFARSYGATIELPSMLPEGEEE